MEGLDKIHSTDWEVYEKGKKAEVFFVCYSTCLQFFIFFFHESSSILKALPTHQNFTEKKLCISKHILIFLPDVFGNPGQL